MRARLNIMCAFLVLGSDLCLMVSDPCPGECTCERLVYGADGQATNCSYLRSPYQVESALSNVPTNTAELLVRSSGLTSLKTVSTSLQPRVKSYVSLLDLSDNHLQEVLSPDLENFTELITLYLSDNHLTHLDDSAFSNTPKLLTLHLDGNKLTSIRRNVLSTLTKLEYLYLSRNNIKFIEDEAFKDLHKLRLLNLSYTDLSQQVDKPFTLLGLRSVVTLTLNHCNISSINPLAFRNLKNLQYLYLENNKITKVPVAAFRSLSRLQALTLGDNVITEVPAELALLTSVRFLYLSRNRIANLDSKALGGLENLQELWLDNNRLKYLPKDLETDFYRFSYRNINLHHNPWRCDCKLIWLVKWLRHQSWGPTDKSPECHWPESGQRHVQLHQMDICDMKCPLHQDCRVQRSGFCLFCPLFSEPSVQGDTCRCLPGYVKTSPDTCSACPNGTYGLHENSCHKCPEGSFTVTNGSSMCACLPGRTYLGNGYCELCPRNTYKSKMGVHTCLACPEYSNAAAGSVAIDNCTCVIDPDTTQSNLYRPVCPKPPAGVSPYNSSVKLIHKVVSTTKTYQLDMPRGQVLGAIAAIISCAILLVIVAIYLRRRRNGYLGVEMQPRVLKPYKMSSSDESRFSDSITVLLSEQTTECDIRIKKIRLGRLIGRGAFGQVHEGFAYCDSTSDVRTLRVAVKRPKINCSSDEKHALKQEYEQMRLLGRHSNIIGLIGSCVLSGQMALILEYAELGDLLSYLKDKSSKLENYVSISPEGDIAEQEKPNITEEKELMVFAWQIARGMTYVHQQKCIHRDLAARNILIAGGPVAKISDFGLSRDVYENGYYFRASKGQLPYKWLSPEALLWGQYSTKSDVWSFGVLLWEITTLGGSPYPGIPVDQIAELHRSGYRLSQPPSCPNDFFQILKACWEEDPRKRPSFAKLCATLDDVLQKVFVSDYLDMQPTSNTAYITQRDGDETVLSLSSLADKGRMDSVRGTRDHHNSSGYSSSITSYT